MARSRAPARATAALGSLSLSEPLAVVSARLVSPPAGLTSAEAERRLAKVGPNEPVAGPGALPLRELLAFLANPLTIILLIASAVSGMVGEQLNAAIIVAIVAVSTALNFAQSYRSHRAAARLRETVAPTARALRDGRWVDVPRRVLVPGDRIALAAGDRVPADARLVESRDLHIQEAALTGESLPVEKGAADLPEPARSVTTAGNVVFLGTSVVSGTAVALVGATGSATVLADVAAQLSAQPPETEFQRGLARFAMLVMRTVLFLVLFVLAACLALRRPPLESLLFAVALAVGLTPEFLPMITTVTLARGAARMARRKVIVKHLAAIEDFGSMDVLCSDKTGTLTSGEMALAAPTGPFGEDGARALQLACLNAAHESGIRSPLDQALLRAPAPDLRGYTKLDEIPFDFERRCVSVVLDTSDGPLLIAKGAPESILPRCARVDDGVERPLDAADRGRSLAVHEALSGRGYRVLAVACQRVRRQPAYSPADEQDLTLCGYVTFSDPPVEGTAEALQALARDGVTVKVLTGDSDLVARHVCEQVGLTPGRIVLGEELEAMTDAALAATAERTTVFARVSPGQKTRILRALTARGHVVGFLGDGINDAPALHAAEVGISVAGAVDVAKDAADIILGQRHLGVLHAGIIEGRRAFANVMKYLLMGTSSNFGNMFSMAAAVLFLPFLPMRPAQILLNNFLYDLAQIAIPTDAVDDAFVARPQRWNVGVIRDFMLVIGPLSSLYDGLTFYVLLAVFRASEPSFQTGWFIESLATQTLVLFVIRTAGSPFRSRPSTPLVATTISAVVLGMILPFTPIAPWFAFVPLPWTYYAFVAVATATYLALVHLVKARLLTRGLLGVPGAPDTARG